MMMHLKNKHSRRVWPSSEIAQEKINSSVEENMIMKNKNDSHSTVLTEEGESEDLFEEVLLESSMNTYTIIDFNPVSRQRNSTTEMIEYNYLPSAEVATNGNQIHAEFDTSQSSPQSRHVTEVNMISNAVPALSASADEHVTSVTVQHSDTWSKYSNWYSLYSKHPCQAIALSILYILIAVIFFPLLLLVFMVCFVSYFTPDID